MQDRNKFDDDAYSDLLNEYAHEADKNKKTEDLHNVVRRHHSNAKPQFHVNIDGLEEEFQQTKSSTNSAKTGGTYYHAQKTEEKKAKTKSFLHAKKQKKQLEDGFSYDEEFGTIITRGNHRQQEPQHRNLSTDMTQPNPEEENNSKSVILKQGTADTLRITGNKILDFFLKNKRAWIIVGICVLCSIVLSSYLISCMNDVLAIHRDSENLVTITIPSETNTKDVLKILKKNDLIEHKVFCSVYTKLMNYRDDNYLSGIYYVTASMGVEKMLDTFKLPPATGESVTITFPEGYNIDQIAAKLEKNGVCTAADFYKTVDTVDFSKEYSFLKDLEGLEYRYHKLEGFMYPDTYEFYKGENASSIVRKFLNNFKKKWKDEYQEKADALKMTPDEIIRLASIIEKEAANAEQMPQVSSVLHNRLNKPGLYPSLQCDSTTEYLEEYIKKNVESVNQQNAYITKYSTYKCAGLPVGAICNPGNDSISAALNPAKTDYYFFAHDDNKKIYLARNDTERVANSIEILNANKEAAQNKKQNHH